VTQPEYRKEYDLGISGIFIFKKAGYWISIDFFISAKGDWA
jgi:hypothetical protein